MREEDETVTPISRRERLPCASHENDWRPCTARSVSSAAAWLTAGRLLLHQRGEAAFSDVARGGGVENAQPSCLVLQWHERRVGKLREGNG